MIALLVVKATSYNHQLKFANKFVTIIILEIKQPIYVILVIQIVNNVLVIQINKKFYKNYLKILLFLIISFIKLN